VGFRYFTLGLALLKASSAGKLISVAALAAVFVIAFMSQASAEAARQRSLSWYLSTVYPDFEAYPSNPVSGSVADMQTVSSRFLAVSGVRSAEPFVRIPFSRAMGPNPGSPEVVVESAAVLSSHLDDYVLKLKEGTLELGPDHILLPEVVATTLGTRSGDRVQLFSDYMVAGPSGFLEPVTINLSVAGVYEPRQGPIVDLHRAYPWTFSRFSTPAIVNLSVLPSYILDNASGGLRYHISINRDAIFQPLGSSGGHEEFRRVKQQIELAAAESGLFVRSQLETAYGQFLKDETLTNLTVLFSLLPLVIVSLALGVLAEREENVTRRRDLLIAKARGAGGRTLNCALLVEGVVEAGLATSLGLPMSIVLLTVMRAIAGPGPLENVTRNLPLPVTLCLIIALGAKAGSMKSIRGLSLSDLSFISRRGWSSSEIGSRVAHFVFGAAFATLVAFPLVVVPVID
jgi:hypothetical protein